MLEGGDQAEPSELSISRKLINCQCRQKINIIGNVCYYKYLIPKGSSHCINDMRHILSVSMVGSLSSQQVKMNLHGSLPTKFDSS